MLEPLRNPANWDNFRKAAVLVLIIWAAAAVLFGISTWRSLLVLAMMILGFVIVCEHLVPQLIVRANPRVVEAYLGKQGAAEAEAGAAKREASSQREGPA